jgi:sugar O-acyltransferase (sialic acid O-acetyltransferase NeuD family)
MTAASKIVVPLLNPNEPEARVAALPIREGQRVTAGEVLCTLETTKSTMDFTAEREGYIVGLQAQPGDLLRAGTVLCWIAEQEDWKPPQVEAGEPGTGLALPEGLRITRPALALAEEAGLDLAQLPHGPLVTQAMVRELTMSAAPPDVEAPSGAYDPTAVVVYGGGGHGRSLIDLLRLEGSYRIVGVLDDGLKAGAQVMGLEVLGGSEALAGLAEQGVRIAINAVGGIGDVSNRIRVFSRLHEAGFFCPGVVHPAGWVETSAEVAAGTQVFAHAYVGSSAEIGYGAIVNTGAVVSHDCRLAPYVNISPGAMLAGSVDVGEGTLIGMGVTVNLNVMIGPGARVGNSAVIKDDVPANEVVRAGAVWPQETR